MDYREEQVGEIEALTSIYEGEIQGRHKAKWVDMTGVVSFTSVIVLDFFISPYPPNSVLAESPHHVFTMPVKTEGYDLDNDDGDSEGLYVLLKFSYTEKYPEEAAVLEIEESDEAGEDGIVEELLEHLGQQVYSYLSLINLPLIVCSL